MLNAKIKKHAFLHFIDKIQFSAFNLRCKVVSVSLFVQLIFVLIIA